MSKWCGYYLIESHFNLFSLLHTGSISDLPPIPLLLTDRQMMLSCGRIEPRVCLARYCFRRAIELVRLHKDQSYTMESNDKHRACHQ